MATDPIIQGESKALPFLIKSRRTGRGYPLTNATFYLEIKTAREDETPVFVKDDADFDKSQVNSGRTSVWLTAEDTYQNAPWVYYGELQITMIGDPIPIYRIPFELQIEPTGLLPAPEGEGP